MPLVGRIKANARETFFPGAGIHRILADLNEAAAAADASACG
jgi:hypothetical protein